MNPSRANGIAACALALVVGGAGCGARDIDDGERALTEGRNADARVLLDAAATRLGDDAPAELHYARALAAYRSGDLAAAARAVDGAAAVALREGPAMLVPLCDFLKGSIAWARADEAEAAIRSGVPSPEARARAIAFTEDALVRWQGAAASRADWPEARRNAERALLRLDRLQERRSDGAGGPPPPPDPLAGGPGEETTDEPDLPPEEVQAPTDPADGPEDPATAARVKELTPDQVGMLVDRLADKEKEKWTLRRDERMRATDRAERDW